MSRFMLGYGKNYFTDPSILELLITTENERYGTNIAATLQNVKQARIDWGDGKSQIYDITTDWLFVNHIYENPGTYYVKFSDNIKFMHAGLAVKRAIKTSFAIGNQTFSGCSNLEEVLEDVRATNMTIPNYTFANCSSLRSIKCKLSMSTMIFGQVTNTFENCSNLELNIEDIFPEDFSFMYLSMLPTFQFAKVFSDCKKITGTAYPSVFWENAYASHYIVPNGSFYNCTSLTNYNDIPEDWSRNVMKLEDGEYQFR